MLLVASPDAVPISDAPPEVIEWLSRRKARAEKQRPEKDARPTPVDPIAREKRIRQREGRIQTGIESLNRWMSDFIRQGLAGLNATGDDLFEEQAKRLIDAQVPGLANRVRRMGELVRSTVHWPEELLASLGRLELLLSAYRRLPELPENLQAEIRQAVGWTVSAQELESQGVPVSGQWLVVGQRDEEEDRLRSRRTWLQGVSDRQLVLILQFAPGQQPFPQNWLVGTTFHATLTRYPGVLQQRGKLAEQQSLPESFTGDLAGMASLEEMLTQHAQALSLFPWCISSPVTLKQVTIVPHEQRWWVRDRDGRGVPIQTREPWRLLAASGGHPVDLFGEWTGDTFLPMTLIAQREFIDLT